MFNSTGLPCHRVALRRSAIRVLHLVAFLGLVAGTTPALAQADGPSAAYAFSETTGSVAVDSSASGTGTALVSGAAHTTGRFGSGLQMDGVDDVVQLPLAESLTFSNAFTVEAWVAPAAFGRERTLWWTPNAMLTLRADGTLVPVALLTGGQVGFLSSPTLRAGVWSHVAMSYDGSLLRLYIDGVDAGSRPATGILLPSPLEPGVLGGTAGFAGKMDELRFYRRALSLDEIKIDSATPLDPTLPLDISARSPQPNSVGITQTSMAVTFSRAVDARTITASTFALLDSHNLAVPATVTYEAVNRTATVVPAAALTPLASYTVRVLGGALGVHDAQGGPLTADVSWAFRTAASSTAPSAFYDFSEAAGTTAADRSGNGNDAVLVSGATWAPGRVGSGLRLDGVDGGVQLPLTQSLAFSNAFTLEAFIAPAAFDHERSFWWTPAAMLTLRGDGTLVPVAILSGGQVGFVSDWALPADGWSHVAVTYNGSMLRLYINGMEAGSRPATGTLVPASPPEAGLLGGASAFAGMLDEVRLYRRALSAAEIAADMTVPAPPVATPFAVTAVTPADLATYLTGSRISATFNRPADAATVTAITVQLRDSAGQLVPAAISYDSAANTVTLTPASPLASSATYAVRIVGGSGGVKGEGGGELAADVQWSFRTGAATPPPSSPAPHISSVDIVSSWAGQAMIVSGSNFGSRQGTSTVTINGTPAFVFSWCNDTIIALLPRGVTPGPVVVKVDGKTSNVGTPQVHYIRW
jgi:hypothetical protein